MGTLRVVVGCPHRLHSPITAATARPCGFCATLGSPGWPREAYAMTVGYGPRLNDAAIRSREPVPAPKVERNEESHAALRATNAVMRSVVDQMATTLSDRHRDRLVDQIRSGRVAIEQGPLSITMQDQSEADRTANVVRMVAEQTVRIRTGRGVAPTR